MGKLDKHWKTKIKDLLCNLSVDAIKSWIQVNIIDQKMEPTFIKTFFNAAKELLDANAFTKDPLKEEFLDNAIKTYEINFNVDDKEQIEASVPVGLTNNTETSA